jgi:L-asparaginase
MAELPRIALIATGGTIDSVGRDRLDLAWYIETGQRLPEGALVRGIPELAAIARVEEVPFRRLASHGLSVRDLLALRQTIQDLFDADQADGVVVTHGTNTLEETAYFLHLTLESARPVVIVGAMRPASALGAEGPLNLLEAVRVAAAPRAHGLGTLVVLNDTIFSARDVTKTATFRVNTFQAPDLGPLGYADADGEVVIYHAPVRRHTVASELDVRGLDDLPRVDVVLSYVEADGTFVDAAVAAGAQGIVSAATGAGRNTPAQDAALERASAQGVTVVISSRVGSGRVTRGGSLRQRGWVAADNLRPWKAKILLALGLTLSRDADVLQRLFDTY